jgi:hypothetical protein
MLCLLAGCGAPSPSGPSARAVSDRYMLVAPLLNQSTKEDGEAKDALPMPHRLKLQRISASSSLSDAYAEARLGDGDLGTSWSPATTDATPTVTFDLMDCASLSGLTMKVGAGVTVDVQVGTTDGWKAIATDLTPEPGKLDWLALRATDAAQVRLQFKGATASSLVVNEIAWFGRRCGGDLPLFAPLPSIPPAPITTEAPVLPSEDESALPEETPSPYIPDGVTEEPTPTPVPTAEVSPEPSSSPAATPTPTPQPTPRTSRGKKK